MSERDSYDGCGVRPLATGKDDPFYKACQWHDQAYTDNSWMQIYWDRKYTDKWFLNQMLDIAGSNKILKVKAYIYYGLARIFGRKLWEGKK